MIVFQLTPEFTSCWLSFVLGTVRIFTVRSGLLYTLYLFFQKICKINTLFLISFQLRIDTLHFQTSNRLKPLQLYIVFLESILGGHSQYLLLFTWTSMVTLEEWKTKTHYGLRSWHHFFLFSDTGVPLGFLVDREHHRFYNLYSHKN